MLVLLLLGQGLCAFTGISSSSSTAGTATTLTVDIFELSEVAQNSYYVLRWERGFTFLGGSVSCSNAFDAATSLTCTLAGNALWISGFAASGPQAAFTSLRITFGIQNPSFSGTFPFYLELNGPGLISNETRSLIVSPVVISCRLTAATSRVSTRSALQLQVTAALQPTDSIRLLPPSAWTGDSSNIRPIEYPMPLECAGTGLSSRLKCTNFKAGLLQYVEIEHLVEAASTSALSLTLYYVNTPPTTSASAGQFTISTRTSAGDTVGQCALHLDGVGPGPLSALWLQGSPAEVLAASAYTI